MSQFECKLVDFGSAVQRAAILVRDEVLRRPLGLSIYDDVPALDTEGTQLHFVALPTTATETDADGGEAKIVVAGALVLVPNPDEPERVKLRQMAVAPAFQGQGVGRELLTFAEATARAKGFTLMYCNARKVALDFYRKLGWSLVSDDEFLEVGIPHYKMQKAL